MLFVPGLKDFDLSQRRQVSLVTSEKLQLQRFPIETPYFQIDDVARADSDAKKAMLQYLRVYKDEIGLKFKRKAKLAFLDIIKYSNFI
jgi:hypothetical protein